MEEEVVVDDELPQESFGLSDDEFEALMYRELHQHPLSEQYPDVFGLAPKCLVKWRQRYRGNRSLWKRLFHKERVLKEFIEAAPIIDAVRHFVDHAEVTSPEEKFTVVDLASGKGFLSMFLSEILPPSKIRRFVLMDKQWPMHGSTPKPHHMSWEHIYGEVGQHDGASHAEEKPQKYIDTWPIPLTTSKQDLKHGNQRRNLEETFLRKDGPVILLAIHLCGILSLKAVNFFNDNPENIRFFALKPCCLPGMIHAKRHEVFSFGDHHSFDSKLVCVQGKWNKDKWCGPKRARLSGFFDIWASNLFLGINDETAKKAKVHIRVQQDGGYQNEFLFAERLPVTKSVWDSLESHMQNDTLSTCLPINE